MEEMTVNQVAELLGKTDRTIRNYIKDNRIKARRVENQFGWEYRVYDLGEFTSGNGKTTVVDATTPECQPAEKKETATETALQVITQENRRLWEEIEKLREVNSRLAYDLGARDQRIKELEQARNLLQSPSGKINNGADKNTGGNGSKPWWKRIFRQ